MAGATLRDLEKSDGGVGVVHGVDTGDGASAVPAPASGGGKSMLLRMIAGDEHDQGCGARRGGGRLPARGGSWLPEAQKAVQGIRPKHPPRAARGLPTQFAVVEPTGAQTRLSLRLGLQDLGAVLRARHAAAPGRTVHLRPRPDQAHPFDASAGQRP